MHLINRNKKIKIVIADTFWKRLRGLMGKKNINYGMLFKKCNSIHTFGMKENIDIIGLNENNEVIYKYENLSKNQIVRIKYPQNKTSVLELPKNASKNIKLNTILLFEDEHEI